ncbi:MULTISPECIES: acyl carrier protein [Pseudobutyrivibrio]|uniref:Acyl carrier protein n=1 Tax=Pseudobutyrivibrio xylanivorans TaxID=185007 RepID=A0A1G5S185_PSEXY|nr:MULTISPECIES: acyl carrier protein [Pseudobutyrivibrio]MDC7280474.1 acyl carrier protein [Butyrivibrio fibrisolvens]SCZ80142.1 acyl carrier protein [Pseudobutyrivibrio xylanivorans]
MEEIFEKIADIIEDVADIPKDEISMDSSLIDDLDLASLEIMAIVAKIEKQFSIKFTEKELLGLSTIEDSVKLIMEKVA